jgi:hypothetical protein
MRSSSLLFVLMVAACSCDNSKSAFVCQKDLSGLGEASVYKTVEQLAENLHISIENFELLESSRKAVNGVSLYCQDKGTIKFFFDNITVYDDGKMDKKGIAQKIKNQIISSAEWIDSKGGKATVKAVRIY